MQPDPVVAEIRETRDRLAARLGYDLRAIVQDARERDAADTRKIVRLPPRRPVTSPQNAGGIVAER